MWILDFIFTAVVLVPALCIAQVTRELMDSLDLILGHRVIAFIAIWLVGSGAIMLIVTGDHARPLSGLEAGDGSFTNVTLFGISQPWLMVITGALLPVVAAIIAMSRHYRASKTSRGQCKVR